MFWWLLSLSPVSFHQFFVVVFFRFVLAIVDSGACVSLMGVSIFYRRCPATSRFLAFYPATPSGAEPTSLVPVSGTCVPHSQSQGGTAPRMHCNTEGEWMVPVGGCTCDAGYEPNHNGSACIGESEKTCHVMNFDSFQWLKFFDSNHEKICSDLFTG